MLNETLFRSLGHARAVLEDWRRDYNEQRPHSKLSWLTPRAFAAALRGHAAGGAADISGLRSRLLLPQYRVKAFSFSSRFILRRKSLSATEATM